MSQKGEDMSLASGHHRIMVAARGALVMMVLGKVTEVCSRPHIPRCYSRVGSSKLTVVEGWWWSCLYERRGKKFGGLNEILSTRLSHVMFSFTSSRPGQWRYDSIIIGLEQHQKPFKMSNCWFPQNYQASGSKGTPGIYLITVLTITDWSKDLLSYMKVP